MDAEVQAFKDKMAEKAAAKTKVLEALAAGDWSTVASQGIKDGAEGKAMQEAQAIADAYVKAHPEEFAIVESYVSPEGHDTVVQMIDAFHVAGAEEAVLKLTMFELARFERQVIGAATRATVRLGNGE